MNNFSLKNRFQGLSIPHSFLDPSIPIFLGIHGNILLLSHNSTEITQYFLVNTVLLIGIFSIFFKSSSTTIYTFKFLYFASTGLILIFLDGGVGSFFTIWLFVLALYLLFLNNLIAISLAVLVPVLYALELPFSASKVSDIVVLQRLFSIMAIGVISISLNRNLILNALEKQKIEHNAQLLQRSNRDLEQFAFVASHDLKAPLNKIIQCIEILETNPAINVNQNFLDMIRISKDSAFQMNDLISDLLTFSQVSTSNKSFQIVNGNVIVTKAIHNLSELIEKKQAKIKYTDLPSFEANEALMISLFQNLIQNGIKFNNSEKPEIQIKVTETNRLLKFSFVDNGIGIREQDAEKIFSIFQRMEKENYPGTGIGLALCKRIIEQHNGQITFESIRGTGSTFFVTIPKVQNNKLAS